MARVAMHETGSAMIETIILMGVLMPMIFGIVMIGKLIDIKQTNEQASRYASWEATVYPKATHPAAVRERFYGKLGSGISSTDVEAGSHRLWGEEMVRDPSSLAGKTAVQIDESTVLGVDYDRTTGSHTVAMEIGRAAGKSGELLDGLSGNSWGLSTNGLVRADIGVQIKENEWLQSGDKSCGESGNYACLGSTSVILVDSWSASNDSNARRRVRSLVPASAMESLGNIVSNVGHLPMFKELKKLDGSFGHVNMDALPEYEP